MTVKPEREKTEDLKVIRHRKMMKIRWANKVIDEDNLRLNG